MRPLLKTYVGWVQRHAHWVLAGWVLLTLGLATQLPGVRVDNELQRFYPSAAQTQTFARVAARFGGDQFSRTLYVRFAPRPGHTVSQPQAVVEMERVLDALRRLPEVEQARGLPDLVKLIRSGLHGGDPALAQLPLEGDALGYSFEEIVQLTLQRLSSVRDFLSPQGTALVVARLQAGADLLGAGKRAGEALLALQSQAEATAFSLMSYGEAIRTFNAATLDDLRAVFPVSAALMVLVLAWTFRLGAGVWPTLIGLVALLGALVVGPSASGAWGVALRTLALALSAWAIWHQLGLRGRPQTTRLKAAAAWGAVFVALGLSLGWMGALGALLLGLVALSFGQLREVYLPLAVVVTASLWTFGLMALTGVTLNFLMLAVFPLLIGVGLDDALHLLVRFRQETALGAAPAEALQNGVVRTGRTLWYTTLSTVAGFGGLLLSPSPPVQAFGLLATFAMLCAFAVTMTLVPATQHVLAPAPRRRAPRTPPRLPGVWFSRPRWAGGWLALVAAVGAVAFASGQNLNVYPYDLRWLLPPSDPQVTLYQQLNEEFKNHDQVQILLEGDVVRLGVVRALGQVLEPALSASPYVRQVRHLGRLLDDARYADAGADARFLERFAADPDAAYRGLVEEAAANPVLQQRVAGLLQPGITLVRVDVLRAHTPEGVTQITDDLTRRFEAVRPALDALGLRASLSGSPFLEALSLTALRQGFFNSIAWAFLLIGLVLVVLFRSLLWSALCLLPMALVIALEMATIHWLGLRISASTALVAAVALGVGVDYTIHLAQRFRESGDLAGALQATTPALGAATGTTLAAFLVLLLGQIPWNRDFGLLSATAIVYAFVVTLLIFPALLTVARPLLERRFGKGTPAPVPAANPK